MFFTWHEINGKIFSPWSTVFPMSLFLRWFVFFHVYGPRLGPGFRQWVKNYTQFFDCISEINNDKADNAKDLDIVMSMYNLSVLHLSVRSITEKRQILLYQILNH